MAEKVLSPSDPDAAYQRMIKHLAVISGVKKELPPRFYEVAAALFERKGGSWAGLFAGSAAHLGLLKGVTRYLVKKGGSSGQG